MIHKIDELFPFTTKHQSVTVKEIMSVPKDENDLTLLNWMEFTVHKLVKNNIEVLKDTQMIGQIRAWCDIFPLFREAKYIYLERPIREVAKSTIRLYNKHHHHLPMLTVKRHEARYKFFCDLWEAFLPYVSHVRVDYEDMIHEPETVSYKLSNYLGRYIDMSLIDPRKTYQASGEIN